MLGMCVWISSQPNNGREGVYDVCVLQNLDPEVSNLWGQGVPFLLAASLGCLLREVLSVRSDDARTPKILLVFWPCQQASIKARAFAAGAPYKLGFVLVGEAYLRDLARSRIYRVSTAASFSNSTQPP